MQDHWLRVAPPVYIMKAWEIGYKPEARQEENSIEDPDDLASFLSTIPGGSIAAS